MNGAEKQWEGQLVDGQFQLREFLGGSDHSAVFLTGRGEQGAEKAVIKLAPADPQNAKIQLSHWEQAAKLSHPHLLRVFESGRCRLGGSDLIYVVTEFAGEDLSQIVPQRPLTPDETRELLKPAIGALAYLHGAGFAHGRVKPANVMAADECVKLSSDGISRIGEPRGGTGKPSPYDAPEALSGGIYPAADVWSLGMALVEVLTQRLPAWERLGEGDPALPDTLPAEFCELARNCLRRQPQRRWNVGEIAAWAGSGSGASAAPVAQKKPAAAVQEATPAWRHALPAIGLGVTALVVMGVITLVYRHPDAEPTRAVAAETRSASARPVEPRVFEGKSASAEKTSASKNGPGDATLSPASTRSDSEPAPLPPKALGARILRGEAVARTLPDISEKARSTIQGRIRVGVRVHVDASGNVTGDQFESAGGSPFFADKALQAARRWRFSPATVNGQNVPSEWILKFEFTRGDTTVNAAPITP